jgi:shikimate dehydrogenase
MSGGPGKERYGLIGYPVSHSMSPAIFAAAFEAEGISASYDLFPLSPEELEKGLVKLVGEGVRGLNVTVPHKTAVLPRMDRLDESAQLTGAVNTVAFRSGGAVGYNTDVAGFDDSLDVLGVPDVRGGEVLVLGAGGAARAVLVSIARRAPARIVIANRFVEKARRLVSALESHFPLVDIKVTRLEEKEIAAAAADPVLCVQATSLGLRPEDPLPIEPGFLPPSCFVIDLVYRGGGTSFVQSAMGSGHRAADGREMLLRQAGHSFFLWFGREAPLKIMKEAMLRKMESPVP